MARTPKFRTKWGDMIAIKVAPIVDVRIPTPNSNGNAVLVLFIFFKNTTLKTLLG